MGQVVGEWPACDKDNLSNSSSSTSSRLYLVTGDSVKNLSEGHGFSESRSCSHEGRQRASGSRPEMGVLGVEDDLQTPPQKYLCHRHLVP